MTTRLRMRRVVRPKETSSRTNSAAQNRYRSNIQKLFQNGLHCLRYRYIDQIRLNGVSILETPLNIENLKVHHSHQTRSRGSGDDHSTTVRSGSHNEQDSGHSRRCISHCAYEAFFCLQVQVPMRVR